MSGAGEGNSIEVDRLLERAAATVAKASFCWLATVDESGAPRLRPMGRLPPEPGDDAWTLRFITDGRSLKAANIRRAGRADLVFQREAEDAFVALAGAARLEEVHAEVRRRWKRSYDAFFPTRSGQGERRFPHPRGRPARSLDPARYAGAVRIENHDPYAGCGGLAAGGGRIVSSGRSKSVVFAMLGGVALLLAAGAAPALAGGRALTPMDVVTIRIVTAPDLDTTARVEPDGTIAFPYLGRIKAAGLTEDQLAQRIERGLIDRKILAGP